MASIIAWIESEKRYRWLVLYTIAAGTFMGPLDSSIVNIALPTITNYFNTDIATIQWVVLTYLLAIGTMLITFGRIGDLYGHKRIYIAGLAIFTTGSLLCSLSWSVYALIGFRLIQALGACMTMAVGAAIVTDVFPPKDRGKALGLNASSVSAGLLLGPVLGGIITGALHWQWIFLINVPIGIFVLILSVFILKERKPENPPKFDIAGAALAFITLICFLVALDRGVDWGWTSLSIIVLFLASIVFGTSFFLVEMRVTAPMLELALFKIKVFFAGNLTALISYLAMFSIVFLMPFYLIQVMGMGQIKAGIILAALPALNIIISPLSGVVSDRIGSRIPSIIGMSFLSFGYLGLRQLTIDSTPIQIILHLLIPGIGSGIFQTPNNSAVMGSVLRKQLGIAAGMIATMRNIGMMLGIAMSSTVLATMQPKYFSHFLNSGYHKVIAQKMAFTSALHDAFLIAAIICAFGVIISFFKGPENLNH